MSLKMLIVDDDAPVVTFLADIGESCGYEIMSANTGDGLLDRVLETGPDVIVLDLVMPDFDGIEVLREFSTHDIQSRILLISGFDPALLDGSQMLARAWKLNVTGTMQKPLDPDAVRECLMEGARAPLIQTKWKSDKAES